MNSVTLFVAFGLFVLALLALLLWPRRSSQTGGAEPHELSKTGLEGVAPQHAKYFPLIRQALDGTDLRALGRRIPPGMRRRLRVERREVARLYLAGLHEDFVRLERFGRMVAALSPKVEARQEAERLWLGMRFRAVYAMLSVRLALGHVPVPAFERLTNVVGSLAARLDASLTSLVEPGPSQAGANLGA